MTGSNRDAALRFPATDLQLNCRHRTDSNIDDAPATGKNAGNDRMLDHLARRARIAADDDRAGSGMRTERLRETRQQRWRQRLADDATHARNADF